MKTEADPESIQRLPAHGEAGMVPQLPADLRGEQTHRPRVRDGPQFVGGLRGINADALEGGEVDVTGSGDNLMVNGAKVICGGVQTANATVYLIDTVLMPAN